MLAIRRNCVFLEAMFKELRFVRSERSSVVKRKRKFFVGLVYHNTKSWHYADTPLLGTAFEGLRLTIENLLGSKRIQLLLEGLQGSY